jgi:hypothetical protein
LAGFVVNRMGDPFDFLFQSFIQMTQRSDRVAISGQS